MVMARSRKTWATAKRQTGSSRVSRGILSLVAISWLWGCGLADIRPPEIKERGIDEAAAAKAREIIAQVEERYAIDRLKEFSVATVVVRDDWPSAFFRTMFMPWPEAAERMRYQFLLGADDSRFEFLEGENQGKVWGIQDWMTYTEEPGGSAVFEPDADILFYLPTYQYFFEMPYRLRYIPLVAYVGEGEVGGEPCHLIFGTWTSPEPHGEEDQYLFYINQKTLLLDQVTYTVRDAAKFAQGTNRFEDFRDVQGIPVAFRQTITDQPGSDNVLHKLTLENVSFTNDVPRETFFPDPRLAQEKPRP
jgi:hypothetical protein